MKIKNIALSLVVGTALTLGAVGAPTETVEASQSISSSSGYKYCFTGVVINKRVYSDIYYMHSDNKGSYFLDPTRQSENVIFMPYKRLKGWGIDIGSMKTGDRYTGVFPQDNWTLIKVKEISVG